MMFYRIEDGDVVIRMGDVVLDGWTKCTMNDEGVLDLDPEAAEIQRQKDEHVRLTQYKADRAAAYPSLTEQADMAYWDRQNGTTTLDDAINAVKAAHPKPLEAT